MLIGTNLDRLKDVGEVLDRNEIRSWVEKNNAIYIETSCRTNSELIKQAFVTLSKRIMISHEEILKIFNQKVRMNY